MKQLFFPLMLMVALGCNQPAKFTNEEISWLVYEEGDSILFRDNAKHKHYLIVSSRTDPSQIKSYYPIEAEVEIQDSIRDDRFIIYLLKDENSFKNYFRIAEVYRPFDLVPKLDSVNVNGKDYRDVYLFQEDSSAIETDVWRVFFSHEYGIIRYDKKNGISCELVSEES